MADDSMEISSEHGGHDANDDIDIDIDFTAGPNDEDYMLEDAESDVEFRESFETVPQSTSDDVMVDDYNPSLPMEEQQDADNDEQFEDIPDETPDAPEMEIANMEVPASDHTERRGSDRDTQVPVSDIDVQLADSGVKTTLLNVTEGMDQTSYPEHVETVLTIESPNPNLHSGLPNDTNILPNSPDNLTNEDETKSSDEKDTLAKDGNDILGDGDHNAEHPVEPVAAPDDVVAGEAEVTDEIPNEQQIQTADMDETYSGIMVSYQDTQYALFSSSEDDDSDSFFLKDRSITQEPISSFLKALREILQEELAVDDELCIAIDVLRLEFGERSAEIDKVTFEELIYLHQQLLRNDGVDSPEPLHFTLGTRPEFAKRFAGLLAGASEGKGLSELIPRDDESESYDDAETSTHLEEGDYGPDYGHGQDDGQHDLTTQTDDNAAALEHPEEDAGGASIHDNSSVPEEVDNILQGQLTGATHEKEEEGEEGDPEPENSTNATSSSSAVNGNAVPGSQEVQSEQASEAVSKSVAEQPDEDGDLIDYGDEEVDRTKRVAPPRESSNATYEAMNEELRRRSLSRAAEIESATESVDRNLSATNGAETAEAQKPANGTSDTDEIDFDIEEEVKQLDDAPEVPHDDEEDGGETRVIQDDSGNVDDYYTGFDDQQEVENGQTYDFEDEFDDEQDVQGEDHLKAKPEALKVVTSTVTEVTSLKSSDTSPHEEVLAESVTVSADTLDIDEIDYDDDLPPATVEKTLEASDSQQYHESREADEIDEIDYEDDDDEGAVPPQSPKSESLQHTSSSTPGKRQRSESMSEVALGEGGKEAKRIRS